MFENLNRNGAFSSRVFLLAVLGLGIGPNAALADATDPTLSQGLSDEGVYQLGEVDSVDLVSGNLTVRVPLGPSYPLGGGFSYGLQAVYNANPWERKETATCNPGSGTPPVTFPYFRPTDTSNAGFGWTVGLGRLEELGPSSLGVMTHKYTYVEPDGTRHGFHWELLGRGTEQDRVFFSTGRSLMRLNVEVGTNEDLQPTSCRNSQTGIDSRCIRLEMPDGTFTEFHRVVEDITPLPTNDLAYWLPTYIGDRFGNFLEVDYSAHEWKLEDSQGRLHKVTFDNSEPDRAYNKIQTVELQRFGDDLSTPSAVYSFERSPLTLVRHQFDEITMGDLGCTNAPDSLRQVTVEVLDRLVLPDDSFYAMTYYDSDIGGDCGQCFGGGGKSGAMKTLRLPTALHYEYRYSVQWGYARGGDGPSGVPRPHERVWGVTTKRRYQFDGATEQPMGKWYYDHGQSPFSTPNDSLNDRPPPCYRRTDVKFFTDWDADEMTAEPQRWRTQYYNTAKAGFAGFENLPFSVCQPDQMDPVVVYDDLYLAGETRDPSDGTVLRSNWVRYEVEWPLTPGFPSEGARRLIQSRTVYHDDEDRWTETRSEDWDGFGHYRKAIRHSNFPHSGPARTIETNYVPGFEPTATPVESDTWNFTRYDSEAVYFDSSNVLEKVLYCFAGADGVGELTGFLKGVRRLTGTDDGGGRDLLSLFTEDADGNVGEEAHYGGDGLSSSGSTVGGSDACSAGSYSPTYRLQHSYSSGVRSLTEKVDSDQEVVLVSLDRDIDPATGLVAASRDPSGVQTNFSYDSMSRPVSRRRATNENTAGVFQQYRFPDDADSNGPLEDEARSCGPIVNGFDSCTGTSRLTQFRNLYDRQGRLRQSWARQPWVGSTAERTRRVAYDELDRRVEETTWRIPEDGSDEFSTLYRDFDALDRPGNIRAPDGKETVFTYFGDRATRIQVQVYSLSGFVTSTRTEVRDGFGRLIRVDESSGPGGDNILTTYRYDQRDRLVAVCVDDDADPFDACAGQSRSFAYDRRGLMMSESHPEMEGPVTYGYDPLGQVIEENPAGALETDGLLYRRDAAG
ncbi:MAG: hypothetical protein K0U98_00720 [Deltaproteobacteria bacterium]|nr:hypothetical protein [Deltaproteobacteria bacterium]